jgi:hypothetical protein
MSTHFCYVLFCFSYCIGGAPAFSTRYPATPEVTKHITEAARKGGLFDITTFNTEVRSVTPRAGTGKLEASHDLFCALQAVLRRYNYSQENMHVFF